MRKAEKLVDFTSPDRRFMAASKIDATSSARLQKSLLKASNLSDFVDLINLDMSEILSDEIEDSIEYVSDTRWQDCVSVKWKGKGVIREFHGDVTTEELEQSAIFVQQHPKFSSACFVIHDFQKCTYLQVSDTDALIMATRAAYAIKSKPTFRSAFVGNLPALRQLVEKFKKVTNYEMPFAHFDDMKSARLFVASSVT